METDIIAAIIGASGVVVAAVAAGIISTRRAPERDLPPKRSKVSGDIKNPHAKFVGKLVDFVSGVTDDDSLKVEVAVNADGRIIVFHDKDWSVNLSHIEFFRDNNRLNFVSDNGESRTFGYPLNPPVAKYLTDEISEVTLARVGKDREDVRSTSKANIKIYG